MERKSRGFLGDGFFYPAGLDSESSSPSRGSVCAASQENALPGGLSWAANPHDKAPQAPGEPSPGLSLSLPSESVIR